MQKNYIIPGVLIKKGFIALFTAWLMFINLASAALAADTEPPVIILLGDNPVFITQGEEYIDEGVIAIDDTDGDLSDQVIVNNPVNSDAAGTYLVRYDVSDAAGNPAEQMSRTVFVLPSADDIPPFIILLGDNPLELTVGDSYEEPGYLAIDDTDGDISASVVVSGAVNTAVPGAYTRYYNVSDAAGNPAEQAVRTVNVSAIPADTAPPVRANGAPSGQLVAGTSQVKLSLSTDEDAVCHYSASPNVGFASSSAMAITGSTTHETMVGGLASGQTYSYYARCQDQSGNANSDDYAISFSIASPPASTGGGSGGSGSYVPPSQTPAVAVVYDKKATSFAAERGEKSVVLNWNNPTDANFSQAIVYRSTAQIFDYMTHEAVSGFADKIYAGTAGTFTDSGIVANLAYYYAVFTVSKDGKYSSPVVLEKKPLVSQAPAETTPPLSAPRNLKNLGGVSSLVVEEVSKAEAREIMMQTQRVQLNDVSSRLYLFIVSRSPHALSDNDKYALAFFIHNGTQTTLVLGAGERTGVLNSYRSVFGKLPRTENEWQDIVKIANGRWPTERNSQAENEALRSHFMVIYKRPAAMADPHDNAAVTVIAYGLRPALRNMDSEKAAIRTYKAIFGKNPAEAQDWDIVRAIAYSGAIR